MPLPNMQLDVMRKLMTDGTRSRFHFKNQPMGLFGKGKAFNSKDSQHLRTTDGFNKNSEGSAIREEEMNSAGSVSQNRDESPESLHKTPRDYSTDKSKGTNSLSPIPGKSTNARATTHQSDEGRSHKK